MSSHNRSRLGRRVTPKTVGAPWDVDTQALSLHLPPYLWYRVGILSGGTVGHGSHPVVAQLLRAHANRRTARYRGRSYRAEVLAMDLSRRRLLLIACWTSQCHHLRCMCHAWGRLMHFCHCSALMVRSRNVARLGSPVHLLLAQGQGQLQVPRTDRDVCPCPYTAVAARIFNTVRPQGW